MTAKTSAMQSLFAAAREDAPDAATRAAMWNSVADATGIAASATVAAVASASSAAKTAATTAAAAALAPKLIVIGALIGAVSAAIGGVVALGWMESQTGLGAESAATAPIARAVHVPARGAQLGEPTPRARDPQQINRAPERGTIVVGPAPSTIASSSWSSTSDLAEEARLVTEARAALVGGDPMRALGLLRKTHHFATRALEPEEMSLEARALRSRGRIDEAAALDLSLKSRFPSHALAR